MNELYHHGIKGQKWGVRRFQNKDGTLTPAGKSRIMTGRKLKYTSPAIESAKSTGKYFVKKLIASTVPGAGILFNAMTVANLAAYAKNNFDKTDYVKKEGEIEKLSKLKKKTVPSSIEDDLKKVNPRLPGQKGTVNNCMYCTAAMEMRRRGYDVRARKKSSGVVEDAYKDWFDNAKIIYPNLERKPKESRKDYTLRSYDNLCNEIEKYGNGARGYVGVNYEKMNVGHSMYWEVSNNKVTFYDGQSKSTKNDKVFSLADPSSYSYARLDNLKLKENVTETVISVDDRR